MERHLFDAEVLRDLRESDTVFTGPGHTHDIVAELLRVGGGHGAHPSMPPCGQARSDVTYPCGSPGLLPDDGCFSTTHRAGQGPVPSSPLRDYNVMTRNT